MKKAQGETSWWLPKYPGRSHAFARPNGHHYHAADAETAHARTQGFFKRHLA
nr:dienelactone hydrolase family protein [Cupriavidus necator]